MDLKSARTWPDQALNIYFAYVGFLLISRTFLLAGLLLVQAFPQAGSPIEKRTGPNSGMTFEVATIKLSGPDEQLSIRVKGRQFRSVAASLKDLIMFAHGLHAQQIIGGPSWLETEKYDVLAQSAGDDIPNPRQFKVMVQKLLIDRFRLTFHVDRRRLSVYAIVVDTNAPKLTSSTGDPNGGPGVGFNGPGAMTVKNATVAEFAGLMQRYVLDRPTIDQSGISGKYDLSLVWTPEAGQFADRTAQFPAPTLPRPDEPPGLFTAIREQLELELRATKARVEVIILDSVQKPSAN